MPTEIFGTGFYVPDPTPTPTPTPAPTPTTIPMPAISVNVLTNAATNITSTSAQLNGSMNASANVHITEHGVYMGTSTSNMQKVATDKVNYNQSQLTAYYSTSKYYGDLQPNTTYYFYQYVVADGEIYKGSIVSFSTTAMSSAPYANTCIGVVKGTNGALAINDAPAASPKNSNQIGRIPEGKSCTVYLDKSSGNWYWIEYDGVQGYAFNKYITLQ